MKKSKPYHQYTDFDKEPGGLRKLDFVVQALERHFSGRPKSEIKILDVGCGNGNISLPLASLGYQVLGIDADPLSIKNVKKKIEAFCETPHPPRCAGKFPNAKFLIFDAQKLEKLSSYVFERPSKNARQGVLFDCVIASEFFEHLKDPQNFAKSVYQTLNPGGFLISSIPNGGSLIEHFRWFLNKTALGRAIKKILRKTILKKETVQSQAESPHLQFFSLRRFKKILENANFKILGIKNSSAIFGETFYLFWRFFLKRGSKVFNFMDSYDNKLSDIIPKWLGVGWMIISEKLKTKS